jgi:hypothetical protein
MIRTTAFAVGFSVPAQTASAMAAVLASVSSSETG